MKNRTITNAVAGLAIGLAVGTAAYAATNMTTNRHRRMVKKTADRAMKNVGEIIETVSNIVG